MSEKNLWNMKLFEEYPVDKYTLLVRAPGGWIYRTFWNGSTTVAFIPYSNEFKPCDKTGEEDQHQPFTINNTPASIFALKMINDRNFQAFLYRSTASSCEIAIKTALNIQFLSDLGKNKRAFDEFKNIIDDYYKWRERISVDNIGVRVSIEDPINYAGLANGSKNQGREA